MKECTNTFHMKASLVLLEVGSYILKKVRILGVGSTDSATLSFKYFYPKMMIYLT